MHDINYNATRLYAVQNCLLSLTTNCIPDGIASGNDGLDNVIADDLFIILVNNKLGRIGRLGLISLLPVLHYHVLHVQHAYSVLQINTILL